MPDRCEVTSYVCDGPMKRQLNPLPHDAGKMANPEGITIVTLKMAIFFASHAESHIAESRGSQLTCWCAFDFVQV